EDALTVLTEEQRIHLWDEVRVLIEGSALADLKPDSSKNRGGNAYYSNEEWRTDEEATEAAGKKVKRLVCIDKW
ncbi:5731_t:CDS:2, partial [Dentiscutata erythropus]